LNKLKIIILSLIMSLWIGSAFANPTFSDKVNNFISNEIEEIKTYQKESWSNSKDQLGRTWSQIKGFFTKDKE
jgi:hypothetical protein